MSEKRTTAEGKVSAFSTLNPALNTSTLKFRRKQGPVTPKVAAQLRERIWTTANPLLYGVDPSFKTLNDAYKTQAAANAELRRKAGLEGGRRTRRNKKNRKNRRRSRKS